MPFGPVCRQIRGGSQAMETARVCVSWEGVVLDTPQRVVALVVAVVVHHLQ